MAPRAVLLALLVCTPVLAGCLDSGPGPSVDNPIEPCGQLETSYEPDAEYNPRAKFNTTNGTMTVLVYGREVPFTAGHFLRLAEQDTYEDTRFHRLFPEQAIFGGDPRSRSDDRSAWGTGGYNYKVVDDFHQFLRHDEEGILSLVSPRPNSAGSQFIITLGPQPQYDDRFPVVGEVIEGLDTAHELARTPTDEQGRPLRGAHLDNVTTIPPPSSQAPPPELSAYGYDCVEAAEPGDTAEHLVAVRNTGTELFNGSMSSSLDDVEGWDVSLTNADSVVVSAGQTAVYGLNVTVPEEASMATSRSFDVTFEEEEGSEASVSLELTTNVGRLGQPATDQDEVQLRYVGVLNDGRAFDTTETVYVDNPSISWFDDEKRDPEPVTLTPTPETLNRSQPGRLVERAQVGETVVGFLSPGEAYGSQSYGENGLGGRLLVFQVQVTTAPN